MRTTARSRLTLMALVLMFGLPLSAFLFGPPAHAAAGGPPGSQLGGFNTTATASAVEAAPLTPGLVGAGNLAKGDLIDVSVPYANSTASTGPSTTSLGAPAYPGDTAAGAGNALATFSPNMPPALVSALNDHALAQSSYPAQVSAGTSGAYAPTGKPVAGLGTAQAQSSDQATTATAAVNNTSLLSGPALVDVTSSTVTTGATVLAGSVATEAKTTISGITIGGVIDIAGLSSVASATSAGTSGQGAGTMKIAAVSVAGVPASIGPDGVQLDTKGVPLPAAALANAALKSLEQAGVTVTTIAPTQQQQGGAASVTSGALQVNVLYSHIPSLQGHVPVNSVGVQLNLGLTQATADATQVPAFPSLGLIGFPASSAGASATPAAATGAIPPTSGTQGQTMTIGTPASGSSSAPAIASSPGSGGAQTPAASPGLVPAAATVLGIPVKVAWVVGAFLLSIVAAGPLLAFANWQLLRGRSS